MSEKIIRRCRWIIIKSFYLLFFLVPLILTPINYELFEYNKMMLTYGLTTVIITAWFIQMIAKKEFKISRTPLDLPLLLFLLSQVVSTVFSIDPHVSLFGYYSRFNGGLLSTITYILLYFAFVSNFPKEKIRTLLKTAFFSAVLVSIYGILEHFGIDKNVWVQDVQNRVFSTLGQPNWLAAYLAILIPICVGSILNFQFSIFPASAGSRERRDNFQAKANIKNQNVFSFASLFYWIISVTFYITLLFTKSRSGFIGFWISLILFTLLIISGLIQQYKSTKLLHIHAIAWICSQFFKSIGPYILIFSLITFFIGTPIPQINRFTLPEISKNNRQITVAKTNEIKSYGSSVIDVGITESGVIRSIVWKGAIDIFRAHPIFGTGVETFAFSYYKYKPVQHNMTSEWDFLYNKAHNEYLNFAANSGLFGLGSYLLIIGVFIWWNIRTIRKQNANSKMTIQNAKTKIERHPELVSGSSVWIPDQIRNDNVLIISLFCGWVSILITNFFGFSVVIVQLFFYLIPAFVFVLHNNLRSFSFPLTHGKQSDAIQNHFTISQYVLFIICSLMSLYFLTTLFRLYAADVFYATGYQASRASSYTSAYESLHRAITLNENEPLYYDELAYPVAQLSAAFFNDDQSTTSAQLALEAIAASNKAVSTSPENVNFWKTRTRVFYTLYQLDEKYLSKAKEALEIARVLSPTDPKIYYNLALLYDKTDKKDDAIVLLQKAAGLKADYRDAYFALGLFYARDKSYTKAKEQFDYILTRINPNDDDAKKQLEELK